MEYSKKSLPELKELCRQKGVKGFSTKKKAELIEMLSNHDKPVVPLTQTPVQPSEQSTPLVRKVGSKIALSLFSGAGGDTCGLEAAGWKVTHFSEFNAKAVDTHKAAFPSSELLVGSDKSIDIKKIPDETFVTMRGSVGLVFAGFPCQGFSHAGKKKSDDPRNELVHEFLRVAKLVEPEWIVGENVRGLLSRKGVYPPGSPARPIIEIIKELFEKAGYRLSWRVVDATEVGVPQLRKRLIIIGHRGSEYPHIPWNLLPIPKEKPTIRSLLGSTLEGAVELPDLYKPSEQDARFWIETSETSVKGVPHPNLVRLVAGIRNLSSKELKEQNKTEKEQFVEPKGLISFGTRAGGYHGQVLDPNGPCKTIICAYNQCPRLFVGLHNSAVGKYWVRCLTPEECGLIQGFPADYPWSGSVKEKITQIGNAVPPPLATAIAKLIEKASFHISPQKVDTIDKSDDSDEENE
jgi:DNA (cytosine-5)-methyltransferase 1